MNPIRTITTLATIVALLAAAGTPFSNAETRDPNSAKRTHYYSPLILLLPYMEQLTICVTDGEKSKPGSRIDPGWHLKENVRVASIRVYEINGDTLLDSGPKSLAPNESGVCFDIATVELGPPGGAPPAAILAELILSAPVESKRVPVVTFEVRDSRSNTSSAVLLPAVQVDAPGAPGRIKGYRPQFYFPTTTEEAGTLTHIFGPFTLTAGQEVEICAADAAKVPTESFSLNFEKIKWTVKVYEVGKSAPRLSIVAEDIEGKALGVCFDGIGIADLDLGEPGGKDPETMGLLILLYASAPPGTQVVPMATGRLKLLILDEPESALLLPAVQAVREAGR